MEQAVEILNEAYKASVKASSRIWDVDDRASIVLSSAIWYVENGTRFPGLTESTTDLLLEDTIQ